MNNILVQKALAQLRLVAARWIAGAVTTGIVFLETKYQIVFDTDTKAGLVTGALAVWSVFYPLLHKQLNRWINPGDAASGELATIEKAETKALREASAAPTPTTNYTE